MFTGETKGKPATRIIDKKGFIKMQRGEGRVRMTIAKNYKAVVEDLYKDFVTFTTDACLRPDIYICIGPRMMDFAGSMTLDQLYALIDIELVGVDDDAPLMIVAIRNTLGL